MVLNGKIDHLTIPSLIQELWGKKLTGTLVLQDEAISKTLYVDSGRVTFAASNDPDDRLGHLYLRQGMIPLAALAEAEAGVVKESRRMGTILVEMKAIRPQDLIWGVTEQVKTIVLNLFQWTRGEYVFTPGPLPTEEVITLKMPTADLILSGIKSIESWSRIRAAIGGLESRYRTAPAIETLAKQLSLSLDEWTLLSRCENGATLGQMCSDSSLPDYEVCRLVWTFTVVGLLVAEAAGAAGA